MHLIPAVVHQKKHEGSFYAGEISTIQLPDPLTDSLLDAAGKLAEDLQNFTSIRPRVVPGNSPVFGKTVTVRMGAGLQGEQHYTLEVSPEGIAISASDEAGAFYGLQTMRQMLRSEGAILPEVFIDDQPSFLHRGFYHDVTRSKVPTLATLKALVDKLAYYKINQLQLYVEHTFAFARHSDIWSGADPLTAEEILELDRYCRANQVELVPSMSTFGHFYMVLRSKRKEHLNELEINGSERAFSYYDRMSHYTLDCLNPESIDLLREMLSEYIPLFSSQYFNICCDETFDLGKGRNKAAAEADGGSGKLYFDFLKQVIGIVSEQGRKAMFWGDIILKDPELIKLGMNRFLTLSSLPDWVRNVSLPFPFTT